MMGRGWHRPRRHRAAGLNDRNDYALEAAKRYPNRFGIMARSAGRPESAALLADMEAAAGSSACA